MKKKDNKLDSRFWEEMKRSDIDKAELVSNDDYIRWLENFTSIYEKFTDDTWLYHPEELLEHDYKNVSKIGLFFDALSDYCRKYYINMNCDEGPAFERIIIKYKDVGYEIGLIVGQGAIVYVERQAPKEDEIEFDDVLNDIVPEDFEAKRDLVRKLEQIVSEMKTLNIPKSVILEVVGK